MWKVCDDRVKKGLTAEDEGPIEKTGLFQSPSGDFLINVFEGGFGGRRWDHRPGLFKGGKSFENIFRGVCGHHTDAHARGALFNGGKSDGTDVNSQGVKRPGE